MNLVNCPVIAVPTSVGYGTSFEGLTALLAMLNSCASGVSVVNIDNKDDENIVLDIGDYPIVTDPIAPET